LFDDAEQAQQYFDDQINKKALLTALQAMNATQGRKFHVP
jgi:hypothetical protein